MKHVCIGLYEFNLKTGKFDISNNDTYFIEDDETPIEMFDSVVKDRINKYFMMRVENILGYEASFYTIRTDIDGNVIETTAIGPNSIDKGIIIDAILGCKPTKKFIESCRDRIVDRIVVYLTPSEIFTWSTDARQRLEKANVLRLKEIYQKLKS